jgi:recombination protein RecA
VRLDMRRVESIKVGQEVVGNRVRVRVVKNKVAPPFKVAEFDIMYNEGISKVGDILDLGVEMELISKRGSFYSYGDLRLGQGRENAKGYLRENPDLARELEVGIRTSAGLDPEEGYDEISSEEASDEELEVDIGETAIMDMDVTDRSEAVPAIDA